MATLNLQVGASGDSGFIRYDTNGFSVNRVYTGYISSTTHVRNGYFRFTGVSALNGSTIDSAILMLNEVNSQNSPETLVMAGDEADASATTFAEYEALPETTAQVTWDKSSFPASNSWFSSPEIKIVIQELVDSHTLSGIAILHKNDGSGTGSSNYFYTEHYDINSTQAAKLDITYTVSSQTVDMNHLDDAALNQPAISAGNVNVGMNHLRKAQVFSPGATAGPVSVGMNHLADAVLNESSVSPGAVSVSPEHLNDAVLNEVSILPGGVVVDMDHLDNATLQQPGVTTADSIGMQHLNDAVLHEPATIGDLVVSMQHLAPSALYPPNASPGNVNIGMQHLNQSVLNQPNVSPPGALITMQHLSDAALFNPSLSTGGVIVSMQHLSTAALYSPSALYVQTVGVNHLQTAQVFTPLVSIIVILPPAPFPDGGGVPFIVFSNVKSAGVGLPASRTWNLVSNGQAGDFSVLVPYELDVASNDYISKTSASRVSVMDQNGSGEWHGYVTDINYQPGGALVHGVQQWAIIDRRSVPENLTLTSVTHGEIVAEAISATPLSIGGIVISPPWIDEYTFQGERVAEVIAEMSDRSGNEFYIGTDGLAYFGPRGGFNGTMLVAGGNLQDHSYQVGSNNQVNRVTALAGDISEQVYEIVNGSDWLLQDTLKLDTLSADELYDQARAYLDVAKFPDEIVSGSVPRDLWSIQEGDYINAWFPQAQWTGVMRRLRVISRSINDSSERMHLEFVIQNEIQPGQTGTISVARRPARRQRQSFIRQMKRWRHEQKRGYSRHWIHSQVRKNRNTQSNINTDQAAVNEDFESRITALEP